MAYQLPPEKFNQQEKVRSVGLEIEFSGLGIQQSAEIIASLYGGKIQKSHRHHVEVVNSEFGDFRIELDARILRKMAQEDVFDTSDLDLDKKTFRKSLEKIIDKLAMSVVPVEIVMPPVPIDELHKLEELRVALQQNKAEGTGASFVHAFGMHINIEAPDLESTTLRKYLQAFMLLYPWLLARLDIDISRRISPFVDPFPEQYVRNLLDEDYTPDVGELISDYVTYNPTRNRPLDMMPIFGMLNNKLIEPVMEGEKNDPRPTFHYRLPNSKVDDKNWRFEDEWNYWLAVEKLVNNTEMLRKLSRLYLARDRDTLMSFREEWAQTVQILLEPDE